MPPGPRGLCTQAQQEQYASIYGALAKMKGILDNHTAKISRIESQ
jgi:hypothetical protein